jgi:hypothetical protein
VPRSAQIIMAATRARRGPERRRPPGQVEEDEVVGEVQFVSGVDVLHQAAQAQQVDLADEHPPVVGVDDGPDPPQPVVDGGPVLVVAQVRLVVPELRVLADPVDDVDAEAVGAPVEPESQDERQLFGGPPSGAGSR